MPATHRNSHMKFFLRTEASSEIIIQLKIITILLAGLNIGGIKNEAIWHLNQNYPGYSGSPGHYGLSNPNITSNTVM